MAALGAAAVPVLWASPAHADIPDPMPFDITVTTPTQTNQVPGATLGSLFDGDVLNVTVAEQTGGPTISSIQIRLCKDMPPAGITGQSAFSSDNAANCVGVDDPPVPPVPHATVKSKTKVPGDTSVTDTFPVSVGAFTWTTAQSNPGALTCGPADPCDLWVRVLGSLPGGNAFAHYDLTFAAAPGPVTDLAAAPGNASASVSWTAPSGPVTDYDVVLTGPGCTPALCEKTVTGTSALFTGLTNFQSYGVSVVANNPAGSSSAATTTVEPQPVPPVQTAPEVGNEKATIKWTYVGSPAGGFTVTVTDVAASTTFGTFPVASGAARSFEVTGLTNGTLYSATIVAHEADGDTDPSNAIQFAPSSTFLTQTIHVARPQGALVLTQVCTEAVVPGQGAAPTLYAENGDPSVSGGYFTGGTPDPVFGDPDGAGPRQGYPYPDDVDGLSIANYPTDCGIDLGAGHLLTSGPGKGGFFQALGDLNQVTIVDTRDSDPGWNVTGTLTDFTDGVLSFSSNQLGWAPTTADNAAVTFSNGVVYDQTVAAGPTVGPNTLDSAAATAWGSGRLAAVAADHVGLGIATLDAPLTLWIPITAIAGSYSAVLTLTAI